MIAVVGCTGEETAEWAVWQVVWGGVDDSWVDAEVEEIAEEILVVDQAPEG